MDGSILDVRPAVAAALREQRPVVALESTLIAHGLPWPLNLQVARAAEDAVRAGGAVPATIAVIAGRPVIGLSDAEVEWLAQATDVRKASRRDLAVAIAQGAHAATTVAATMALAHAAGIRVFATGGIGGVHPAHDKQTWDISADLVELGRTPVAVVCAGAKTFLDQAATLELLETQGVPVLGWRTAEWPAFYLRTTGYPVTARVEKEEEAAAVLRTHWALGGAGVLVVQPVAEEMALPLELVQRAQKAAEAAAARARVQGPALTPFLLARMSEFTEGRTLQANQALILANADLAARLARTLAEKR